MLGSATLFVNDTLRSVFDFLINKILPCVIIIVVAIVVLIVVKSLIKTLSGRWKIAGSQKAATVASMLTSVSRVLIGYFAVVSILSVFNMAGELMLAVTSIFGVALGFALQSFVKDFVSGTTFLVGDMFNVGDVVTVAGETGIVVSINLTRTMIKDTDGHLYSVPNGSISTIKKVNITDDNRGDYISDNNKPQ